MVQEIRTVTVRGEGEALMNNSEMWSYFDAISEARESAAKKACGTSYQDVSHFTLKRAILFKNGERYHAKIVAEIQCKRPANKEVESSQKSMTKTNQTVKSPATCTAYPRFERPFCRESDETRPRVSIRDRKL